MQLASAAIVPLSVLGVLISRSTYPTLAIIFACFVPVGALGYWLVPRYEHYYDFETEPDLESTQTVRASLVKLGAFCVLFGMLGYFWVVLEFATVDSLIAVPSTARLAALGVLPGAFLGAGVPLLAQRDIVFHRLQNSQNGQFAGNLLTFGAFLSLLTHAQGAVSGFVAAYVVSRLAVLVDWQVASRN